MFWGISLEVGKRYSQTVEKSFHISMAALNASNTGKGCVTIVVEVEKACYPLCTLQPERIPQQALDYIFTEGEEVLFYTEGDLDVHLTGYLIDEPNPMEYSTDEEEESAANSNASSSDEENNEERKLTRKKKPKVESSEEENLASLISELDDLNEDNEGDVDSWLPRSARKKQRSGDLVEGMETTVSLTEKLLDDDSEDSEDDDEWQPGGKRILPKKKSGSEVEESSRKEKKLNNSLSHVESTNNMTESNDSPSKQVLSLNSSKSKKKSLKDKEMNTSNGLHENTGSVDVAVDKNCSQDEKHGKESNNKMEMQTTEEKSHHERKELAGGTIIEDIAKGQGKKAKKGKQVSVYYKGSLKKSKKQFDAKVDGNPFIFKLGCGEVMKGWDVGIEGMQVGGKRKITIPPSQGYGSKQVESSIPPNSTLVFIVDLVKVH